MVPDWWSGDWRDPNILPLMESPPVIRRETAPRHTPAPSDRPTTLPKC